MTWPTHLALSCTLAQPLALLHNAGRLLPYPFTPYPTDGQRGGVRGRPGEKSSPCRPVTLSPCLNKAGLLSVAVVVVTRFHGNALAYCFARQLCRVYPAESREVPLPDFSGSDGFTLFVIVKLRRPREDSNL